MNCFKIMSIKIFNDKYLENCLDGLKAGIIIGFVKILNYIFLNMFFEDDSKLYTKFSTVLKEILFFLIAYAWGRIHPIKLKRL